MPKQKTMTELWKRWRLGSFLAIRQVRRTSRWTNGLIIFIMMLTFLNLVVVGGILVGLIQGAVEAINAHYLGDIFISTLKDKSYIDQTPVILSTIDHVPGVEKYTARYLEIGTVEADYKSSKKRTEKGEIVSTAIAGINPAREDYVADISSLIIEGSYLNEDDFDQVVIGAMLLKKYLPIDSPNFPVLDNVGVGTKLRLTVNGNVREVTVKGLIRSKVDELDRRVFFPEKQFRGLIGRHDYNVDEIVLKLKPGVDPLAIKNILLGYDFDDYARIQTQEESEPKFIKDIKATFALLGSIISSIGLVVAAITIFIIIFVNAITRRKFIGILKGIGIEPKAIELAYVIQSLFYAVVGTALGVVVVFGFLEPYLRANPIDFPFSDGILVVTWEDTLIKIIILLGATFIAGLVPARMIVRQNTLDAILGR